MGKRGSSDNEKAAAAASSSIDFIPNDSHRRAITHSGTEIRVHGVGDHATFSALGKPGYENRRQSQVVICEPPQLPEHHLLLIAWSRANRRLTRTLWWYLLFPFTLINVAGYMTPRRVRQAQILRASISVVSVILTVSLAAWVTVIAETIVLGFATSADTFWVRLALCASGPVAVGALIVKRMRRNDLTSRCGQVYSAVHLGALAALAVVCFRQPATWKYALSDKFDPMTCILIGSTGLVVLVALVLSTLAVYSRQTAHDGWTTRDSSALAGAALLTLVATALLHTAASLLRLVTEWSTALLYSLWGGQHSFEGATGARDASAGVAELAGGWAREPAHMLLPTTQNLSGLDLLLGFFVTLMVILAVNIGIAAAVKRILRPTPTTPHRGTRGRRPMSLAHNVLRHVPGCLSFVVLSTSAMTLGAWIALRIWLHNMDESWIALSRNAILVVGIIAVVFAIIRRPERAGEWIKGIFQMVADIAGFWAPRSVPLAGASYRLILMEGVDEAMKQAGPHPVALVGHSQGSVICAWYMATRHSPQSRITLFTCGSPLWSLYAAFFPTFFGRDFFDNVARNSADGRWFNYWRLTDPIATALPCARDYDVTEERDEPLRGHSEYWREAELRADIASVLHVGEFATQV